MKQIILVLVLICSSFSAVAATEKRTLLIATDITAYRAHSINHSNVDVRNAHMVWATGLEGGCNSVYYFADKDTFLHSAVISGLLKDEKVTVIYDVDSTTRAPWGDTTSCQLTSFTIQLN